MFQMPEKSGLQYVEKENDRNGLCYFFVVCANDRSCCCDGDPPQMEDPTPMRVAVLSGILNARRRIAASNSAVQMVPTMIGRDCFPVCRMTVRLRPNPSRTTAHWSTFLETKVIPLLNGSFFFKNRVTIMPIRMEKTGPPTTGTALPKNHAGMAMAQAEQNAHCILCKKLL